MCYNGYIGGSMNNTLFENIFIGSLVVLSVAMLAFLVYDTVQKDDFTCDKGKAAYTTTVTMVPVMIGKVMVPQMMPITVPVCIEDTEATVK